MQDTHPLRTKRFFVWGYIETHLTIFPRSHPERCLRSRGKGVRRFNAEPIRCEPILQRGEGGGFGVEAEGVLTLPCGQRHQPATDSPMPEVRTRPQQDEKYIASR